LLVKYWMRTDIPKVGKGTKIREVKEECEKSQVLIVVDEDGKFVGFVDCGNLPDDDGLNIDEFVISKDCYLKEDDHIEHAALLLVETGERFLPVLDSDGKPVGTIGTYDILDALIHLTAFEERGVKVFMTMKDRPGQLKKVVDLFYVNGINILSVLTHKKEGMEAREVAIKVDCSDMKRLKKLMDDAGIEYDYMTMEEGLWNNDN